MFGVTCKAASQYGAALIMSVRGGGGNMPVYIGIALGSILVLDALTHCIAL